MSTHEITLGIQTLTTSKIVTASFLWCSNRDGSKRTGEWIENLSIISISITCDASSSSTNNSTGGVEIFSLLYPNCKRHLLRKTCKNPCQARLPWHCEVVGSIILKTIKMVPSDPGLALNIWGLIWGGLTTHWVLVLLPHGSFRSNTKKNEISYPSGCPKYSLGHKLNLTFLFFLKKSEFFSWNVLFTNYFHYLPRRSDTTSSSGNNSSGRCSSGTTTGALTAFSMWSSTLQIAVDWWA